MLIKKKVLIVDGNDMDRQFLRYTLTNASYVAESADNMHKALQILDEESFDAFIIDIHMAEMEGIKLIKKLRDGKNYHTTPILAVTTANVEALRQKGETLGISDWLTKPFSPHSLLNILRKLGVTNQHQFESLA
ncbi:MAG: response regulator [Gammaproteobacteria bacterium]|nr:response regulator [Gammaproteobacteria bacterium]